ncbi:MAG: DUF523 domain-containing protein [Gammaproteobacteria bacterium]|nr:DUF523 domain-containing protein [Gammaproteobacteria bacterium]
MVKISPKPILAISSCLLGENVRYDGGNKRDSLIVDRLGEVFDFLPICPEVGIGLGVPRPPIQMVMIEHEIQLRGVSDPKLDVTGRMVTYARENISICDQVCGYILKSKSPSCGINDVPVYNLNGVPIHTGPGMYAREILSRCSNLPLIDEDMLQDKMLRDEFMQRVSAHYVELHKQSM